MNWQSIFRALYSGLIVAQTAIVSNTDTIGNEILQWLIPAVIGVGIAIFAELAGKTAEVIRSAKNG